MTQTIHILLSRYSFSKWKEGKGWGPLFVGAGRKPCSFKLIDSNDYKVLDILFNGGTDHIQDTTDLYLKKKRKKKKKKRNKVHDQMIR